MMRHQYIWTNDEDHDGLDQVMLKMPMMRPSARRL